MKISYNKENKYYLLNDTIIIDADDCIILSQLKNKSNNCLECKSNIWYYKSYKSNDRLIDILYPNDKIISFKCINDNYNDYRKENIKLEYDYKFYDKFDPPTEFNILKQGESHKIHYGKFSGQYRNMYWKVELDNETFYIMHIINNTYTKISKRDINKVLNYNGIRPFWYVQNNGYIATTIQSEKKIYYLHQYIMDVHNEDLTNYEKTIDHINRDKLDNRRSNLRFATMSEQNTNKDKATRRCDAKTELPEYISVLPKYIQFRREVYDKVNNSVREFFIINHPSLDKTWETSKSVNVATSDKFIQAKLKLELIEDKITETQYNKESGIDAIIDLPKYIVIKNKDSSFYFSYDYTDYKTDTRYTLKNVIKTQNIQTELIQFIEKINIKYPDLKFPKYNIQNISASQKLGKQIIVKEEKIKDIDQMKVEVLRKDLPPNFTIQHDKGSLYIAFSKYINGQRYNMKKVMKSEDVDTELKKLTIEINKKFNLKISLVTK